MTATAFLRAGHLPTLLACLLHFETSFMVWVLMGGLGVLIAEDLQLTPAETGLIVGIPLLGGALSRVPVGALGDRLGAKRVGIVTMAALVVPLTLAWRVAADLPGLVLVGALLGLAGSSFAVALPLAGRAYPARWQGTAMGIAAAGNSGTVLATLLAPRLGDALGWQNVFGAAIVPVITVAALFALLTREPPDQVHHRQRNTAAWQVVRDPALWWFALLYSATFGGYSGFSTFLSVYFHSQYRIDPVTAGGLVAACAVASSLARPLGGMLADRFGGTRMLTIAFAGVPIALLAPAMSAPLAITVISLVAAMAGLGIGNGAIFQLVPQRLPHAVGFATGVIGAAGGLGGFALPATFGLEYQVTGSYAPGFLLYGACLTYLGYGLLALRGAPDSRRRAPATVQPPSLSDL